MSPSTTCTAPVVEYLNKKALGKTAGDDCVIGGLIPSGCGWSDAYTSQYFFGDHGSGNIYTIATTADRRGVTGERKTFAKLAGVSGFRMGADGGLYVISYDGNSVVRIRPKDRPASCAAMGAGGGGGAGASGGQGGQGGQGGSQGEGGEAGSAGEGGAGGEGGEGAGGEGAGGSDGEGGQGPDAPAEADAPGCGCAVPGRSKGQSALLTLVGVAVAWQVHRRLRRRSK